MSQHEKTQVLLAARPVGLPKESDFEIVRRPTGDPGPGEVLVRVIYLSLDPYQRGFMDDRESYGEPVALGAVMEGGTVGEVIESRDETLKVGDIVLGHLGWQSHGTVPTRQLRKLDPKQAPISTALGILGMTGETAHTGLLEVGRPQAGETVFVSAASGAVGGVVAQIARIKGCRAVGCAGSDAKVTYCRDVLAMDGVFNYKTDDLAESIAQLCPDGIDVYFDNVGGPIADAAFARLNDHGRVVLCGTISNYNAEAPPQGPRRDWDLIVKRIRMEGFIVTDFGRRRLAAAREEIAGWIKDDRLHYREDIVEGLEAAPAAFQRLFDGRNFGKLLIKVSDEPGPP